MLTISQRLHESRAADAQLVLSEQLRHDILQVTLGQ